MIPLFIWRLWWRWTALVAQVHSIPGRTTYFTVPYWQCWWKPILRANRELELDPRFYKWMRFYTLWDQDYDTDSRWMVWLPLGLLAALYKGARETYYSLYTVLIDTLWLLRCEDTSWRTGYGFEGKTFGGILHYILYERHPEEQLP